MKVWGIVFITAAILSCSATSTRHAAEPPGQLSVQSSDLQGLKNEFPGEEEFGEVAMAAPSFAGFYYSSPGSDTLVVAVANMLDAVPAKAAVARIFARKMNIPPDQTLSVRQVPYSFLQLHRWRKLVDPQLLRLPQVTMVDLDEANNTVTVGTAPKSDTAPIHQIMRSAGLPSSAYRIKPFGPVQMIDPEVVNGKTR